jgi:hypothetical protein
MKPDARVPRSGCRDSVIKMFARALGAVGVTNNETNILEECLLGLYVDTLP